MQWQSGYYQLTHDLRAMAFQYPELNQVMKFTSFLSGSKLRLTFTNFYGSQTLKFDQIIIANNDNFNHAVQVTTNHQAKLVIPEGQAMVTDPVDFTVQAGQAVYIKVIANQAQTYCDFAVTYDPTWVNASMGRHANHQPPFDDRWQHGHGWVSLSMMEVWTQAQPKVVEFTGDSLVETGMVAAELFKKTIVEKPEQITWLVTGISGNRLLTDAPQNKKPERTYGLSLLHRYGQLGHRPYEPSLTLVSIGANDLLVPFDNPLGMEQIPSLDRLKIGYRALESIIESRQSEVKILTLPPVRLPRKTGPLTTDEIQIDQVRQSLNAWLRSNSWVIDACGSITDDKGNRKPAVDFGDNLHLSPYGGQLMGQAIWAQLKSALQ